MPGEDAKRFDPFETVDNMLEVFTYHAPNDDQKHAYEKVRGQAMQFAAVMSVYVPPSADRTAALRKLRECVMTCNAAIALKGKV